jgi:hypothetical protein
LSLFSIAQGVAHVIEQVNSVTIHGAQTGFDLTDVMGADAAGTIPVSANQVASFMDNPANGMFYDLSHVS